MTLEEKLDLIGGVDGFFIRGVPRLGVPRLKMADGPMGVRNYGPATAMPGGIGLTATWNTALAGLLFGDANPSGRLPVTFERRWDDNPVHDSYYPEPGEFEIFVGRSSEQIELRGTLTAEK